MRGTAMAPNSPRDNMLGLVEPNDPIHSEIASKSKPRQAESLGVVAADWVLTGASLLARRGQREGGRWAVAVGLAALARGPR